MFVNKQDFTFRWGKKSKFCSRNLSLFFFFNETKDLRKRLAKRTLKEDLIESLKKCDQKAIYSYQNSSHYVDRLCNKECFMHES